MLGACSGCPLRLDVFCAKLLQEARPGSGPDELQRTDDFLLLRRRTETTRGRRQRSLEYGCAWPASVSSSVGLLLQRKPCFRSQPSSVELPSAFRSAHLVQFSLRS